MQNDSLTNRRRFIRDGITGMLGVGILAGDALAVPPVLRPGRPSLKVALAAYSLRDQFAGTGPGRKIDMVEFIHYCAAMGISGAELTSYYFSESGQEYFIDLKRQAFLHGITISGTAVGNSFTDAPGEKRDRELASVKTWIQRAAWLGAPHIRVFAGDRNNLSQSQAKSLCIEALEECGEVAGKYGIFLGIENHGGIVSEPEELVDIVKSVKNPWIGINLDTGNFHTADPYQSIALCAPWAVNVQYKVEIRPAGQKTQPTDAQRVVKILRDVNYQGWVVLEHEKAENPWQTIPGHIERLKDAIATQD